MYRIFLTFIVSGMLVAVAYGQQTSINVSVNSEGAIINRIVVSEPGDAPPKEFFLSHQALDFTASTVVDELLESQILGMPRYPFDGNDVEVAATQILLGMTAEQVALLAQRRFEQHENTKDESFDIFGQLTRFDKLLPEEILFLEQRLRFEIQEQDEGTRRIKDEVLTPEQIQLLAELDLVKQARFPTLNPQAYASLGLSDKQQEELANLFRESKAEVIEATLAPVRNMRELFQELFNTYGTPGEEFGEVMKKMTELPEEERTKMNDRIGGMMRESLERNKAVAEQIETRIGELLTPQQRERFANLKKKLERRWGDQIAKQRERESKGNIWVPGPDSWKPGDPVPEGAVPPRPPGRFPRGLF